MILHVQLGNNCDDSNEKKGFAPMGVDTVNIDIHLFGLIAMCMAL